MDGTQTTDGTQTCHSAPEPAERAVFISCEPLPRPGNGCCPWWTSAVDRLSLNQRLLQLVRGYRRQHSSAEMPSALDTMCVNFIGGPPDFYNTDEHINALWTDREIKKALKIDCCGYNTRPRRLARCCGHGCAECCGEMAESCGEIMWAGLFLFPYSAFLNTVPVILCTICNIAMFTAKDIALLLVAQETDCADGTSLAMWTQVAAVGHMAIVVPLLILAWLTVRLAADFAFGENWPSYQPDWVPRVIVALMVPWAACIALTVLGFVFWDDMKAEPDSCSTVVLSWCVIELIEVVLSPLFFLCWYWLMGIASYDDG